MSCSRLLHLNEDFTIASEGLQMYALIDVQSIEISNINVMGPLCTVTRIIIEILLGPVFPKSIDFLNMCNTSIKTFGENNESIKVK
jgi:hypothetical protein